MDQEAVNAAVAAAIAANIAAQPVRPFKPNGSPPDLDMEAEKESIATWEQRWSPYLKASNIDLCVAAANRAEYKAMVLLTAMSPSTLEAVMSSGLSAAQLDDPEAIIGYIRDRCNAGRNRHVWRNQFSLNLQRPTQSADNWLCELRDLCRKCDFNSDCCGRCESTRILGQVIHGVHNNEVRIKLQEKGDALDLDTALESTTSLH